MSEISKCGSFCPVINYWYSLKCQEALVPRRLIVKVLLSGSLFLLSLYHLYSWTEESLVSLLANYGVALGLVSVFMLLFILGSLFMLRTCVLILWCH